MVMEGSGMSDEPQAPCPVCGRTDGTHHKLCTIDAIQALEALKQAITQANDAIERALVSPDVRRAMGACIEQFRGDDDVMDGDTAK